MLPSRSAASLHRCAAVRHAHTEREKERESQVGTHTHRQADKDSCVCAEPRRQTYLSTRSGTWLFTRVGARGLPHDYVAFSRYASAPPVAQSQPAVRSGMTTAGLLGQASAQLCDGRPRRGISDAIAGPGPLRPPAQAPRRAGTSIGQRRRHWPHQHGGAHRPCTPTHTRAMSAHTPACARVPWGK
jgi:hypothetical protein